MGDTDFFRTLQQIGLEQYHAPLVREAFDSWQILAHITEQDMIDLGMRLGHRRVLQNAIARLSTGQVMGTMQHQLQSVVGMAPPPATSVEQIGLQVQVVPKTGSRPKRKYVRHPKADENAPQRPPTGYVLFSNWIREGLKDKQHDFPGIAKLVGRRWQACTQAEKDHFLNEAKRRKDLYAEESARYKRTTRYREYQRYLLDFKIRNGNLPPARPRARLNLNEDSMSVGTPSSEDPSDDIMSNVADDDGDYDSIEPRPLPFPHNMTVGSVSSASPPSVIRSPPSAHQRLPSVTYDLSSRRSSNACSPITSGPRGLSNVLPSINGIQTRRLPPLNMTALQH